VLEDRPVDARAWTPIDSLFRSIANDRQDRSVGVVLSGMGTDGTIGLAAIKENLGFALVQTPTSAAYDEMPSSAIAADLADFVGTPTELATRLNALIAHTTARLEAAESVSSTVIAAVLGAIRARTGHDFSQYKKSTIERRVERRMNLNRMTDARRYVELLQRDQAEVDRLFSDLLIGVTRFFRDPEAFDALKAALPELLQKRASDRPLRVWIAGCATGEEAYSVAIAIREHWEDGGYEGTLNVQIYATDLDRAAIERARKARYGLDIAVDVSPERLARFFVEEGGYYRVKKSLRDMIVFAKHDIITDPPFTKIDILSCRNLLIYLELELQRKVVPLFFYALVPGGLLFLGKSEGVGKLADRFRPVDASHKIFKRSRSMHETADGVHFPITPFGHGGHVLESNPRSVARRSGLPDVVQRAVVEHVAPPVIVIARNGDLLFASRRVGRYLEPATGKANVNVFAMARDGLSLPLQAALRKALARKVKVTERGVRVRAEGHSVTVDLSVWPLAEEDFEGSAMVAFVEREEPRSRGKGKGRTTKLGVGDRSALAELKQTKAKLALLMSEMSASHEHLQGVNEELQSANEELQSTNEELTTSKEEMQSMNEELLSLNAELQTTNEQLTTANDDMRNLLNSSQIPTLFLDNDLRLKRYTVQASRIARLIPTDVGRPVTDLTWSLQYETLASDVKEVLHSRVFKEVEVTAHDGSVFMMRIHPYRTTDDLIDGVVVTFVDITAQKRALAETTVADRQLLLERTIQRWPGIAYVEEIATARSITVSDATEKLLGYPRTVLAIANEDFWHGLRRDVHRQRRLRSRAGAQDAYTANLKLRCSNGTLLRCREHATVVARNADGEGTHVLHVFRRLRATEGRTHGRKAKVTSKRTKA
jgi:two-component system CheB/CheR fusion protein